MSLVVDNSITETKSDQNSRPNARNKRQGKLRLVKNQI